MSKQVLKKNIPVQMLYELLEKICIKKEKYYLFDNNAFRKMTFYNLYGDFEKQIIDYYHISKQHYVTRKLTYLSITNIIRQICKSNNTIYTSKMNYNESKYNIDYYVYFA